jgi:hypothetical protein
MDVTVINKSLVTAARYPFYRMIPYRCISDHTARAREDPSGPDALPVNHPVARVVGVSFQHHVWIRRRAKGNGFVEHLITDLIGVTATHSGDCGVNRREVIAKL